MNDLSRKISSDAEPAVSFFQNETTASLSDFKKSGGEKCVIFFLNSKTYAVSAESVREVIVPLKITSLPEMPDWFSGIANLRGKIISVMDLSKFWNKEKTSLSPKSKLILLRSKKNDLEIAFGVDRVSEISVLPFSDVRPDGQDTPDFYSQIRCQTGFVNLLDAERLLAALNSKF